MRKVSSHYCLRPNGTWAKRPVIELDGTGKITGYREMGDEFVEEPGLEYFPGVIIPSFIMVLDDQNKDKEFLTRCIVNGTRRFICSTPVNLPRSVKVHILDQKGLKQTDIPWEILRDSTVDIGPLISEFTCQLAKTYHLSEDWGTLNVGSDPGLLVLQGLDLKSFCMTPQTRLKVIVE